MASKTPDGTWRVRWREGEKHRGRTFKKKADAVAFERTLHTDIARGDYIAPSAGDITVAAWADEWLELSRGLGDGGRDTYRRDLDRHIIPTLGQVPLAKLTAGHVDGLLTAKLADGYAPSTVHRVYRTLHRLCEVAVTRGRIARNPCAPVEPPRIDSHEEMRFLSIAELEALAGAMPDRYRALILVAGYGGPRWSELIGLRRRDVDADRVTIATQVIRRDDGAWHRDAPKTKAGRRTITLPASVAAELAGHLEERVASGPDSPVFTTSNGTHPIASSWTASTFKPACVAAGLGGWVDAAGRPVPDRRRGMGRLRVAGAPRVHDLRHTAVALAIAAGAHPKAIQARLGHASISITLDRYGHLFPEMDERIAVDLEQLRNPPPPSSGSS